MIQIPAAQACVELDLLLHKATQGQEVVIISSDGVAFKLTALPRLPRSLFGSAQGLTKIEPDFDEPLEGFEAYIPNI